MNTYLSLVIGALCCAHSLAAAGSTPQNAASSERSPDLVMQPRAQSQPGAAVAAVMDDASIAAVTPEQVGDADSFGRKVKYLGLTQTRSVALQADCTGFDGSFGDRCVVIQPTSTSFVESDLARIDLPAKATHSLLCFSLTPVSEVRFDNPTAAPRLAQLRTAVRIIIENEVLNDAALRDPITGLPFGGQIETSLGLPLEMRTIAPGAVDFKSGIGPTRSCIAGFLSKQSLIDRGLTEKQALQFFRKPITLRFGATGFVTSASSLQIAFGMRIYGD